MECNHIPIEIEVETQDEHFTSLTAKCESCGVELECDIGHAIWRQRDKTTST